MARMHHAGVPLCLTGGLRRHSLSHKRPPLRTCDLPCPPMMLPTRQTNSRSLPQAPFPFVSACAPSDEPGIFPQLAGRLPQLRWRKAAFHHPAPISQGPVQILQEREDAYPNRRHMESPSRETTGPRTLTPPRVPPPSGTPAQLLGL